MDMKILSVVFMVICACDFINGQVVFLTNCRVIPSVQGFNMTRWLGRWYEIKRYNTTFQSDGDCVTADYTSTDTDVITVTNQMTFLPELNRTTTDSYVKLANSLAPTVGSLQISYNLMNTKWSDYNVIATDFENYAIVWSCRNTGNTTNPQSLEFAWILSRERNLSAAIDTIVNGHITTLQLNAAELRSTEQSLEMCSDSIGECPVTESVQDFNMTMWLGKWYEIKRYSSAFQMPGDCVTADFTVAEGNLIKVTKQMSNLPDKSRITSENWVQLSNSTVPNDGSLQLSYNLTANVWSDYNVIATDFINYAIVYSCITAGNATNPQSFQFAWVLSRQRTLSAAIDAIVNGKITTLQLNATEFRSTEQRLGMCSGSITIYCSIILIAITSIFNYFI